MCATPTTYERNAMQITTTEHEYQDGLVTKTTVKYWEEPNPGPGTVERPAPDPYVSTTDLSDAEFDAFTIAELDLLAVHLLDRVRRGSYHAVGSPRFEIHRHPQDHHVRITVIQRVARP